MRVASPCRNIGRSENSVTRAFVRCAAAIAISTPAAPPPTTAMPCNSFLTASQRAMNGSNGFAASACAGAALSEPTSSDAVSYSSPLPSSRRTRRFAASSAATRPSTSRAPARAHSAARSMRISSAV
jgi:hypothetical protein